MYIIYMRQKRQEEYIIYSWIMDVLKCYFCFSAFFYKYMLDILVHPFICLYFFLFEKQLSLKFCSWLCKTFKSEWDVILVISLRNFVGKEKIVPMHIPIYWEVLPKQLEKHKQNTMRVYEVTNIYLSVAFELGCELSGGYFDSLWNSIFSWVNRSSGIIETGMRVPC